jgi:hypothetical protein
MTNTSATGGFLSPVAGGALEDAALDALLQQLVVGVTSLPGNLVRPRWQPVPAPVPERTVNWCAIGVVDEDPESNISLVHSSAGDGSSTSYDVDTISVLASFYGPNARGNAKLLRTGLMIGQNRETLYNTGLALREIPGKSVFLPEMLNGQTQRRVDLPIRFYRRTATVWPIQNQLKAQVTVSDDRGNTVQVITPSSLSPLKP